MFKPEITTKWFGVSALIGMAVVTANAAQAITLTTSSASAYTQVAGAQQIFFEGVTPRYDLGPGTYTENGATYSGEGAIRNTSIGGVTAAPPTLGAYVQGSNNNFLTLGANEERGPVTIDFAKDIDYFGLYWGSIDSYNSIQLLYQGAVIGSFSGTDVHAAANGDQSVNGARYVNFFATGSERFDQVRLFSNGAALESDNHAYRDVPTPAVLLPAIGGMFAGAVRRKQRSV